MPPLNPQTRLTALTDQVKQTSILITRLSKLSLQPGSLPLSPSAADPDARLELAAEIHASLKEQDEALELLWQEVEDYVPQARGQDREREKAGLRAQAGRIAEDLKLARTSFRRAQLTSKRNAEAAKRKERSLLFSGAANQSTRRAGKEKLTQEELVVNASTDVTAALRRTHNLMSSELSRSQFAHDTLQQSTAALATLGEHYSTLDDLLASSRNLLSTLIHSQKSDTWYLESAFYVLLVTIAWLVFRRFLYGPLWWLVYLPLKLFYKSTVAILVALGVGNTNKSELGLASSSLIVQPSATGGLPKYGARMGDQQINVGAGGRGVAGEDKDRPLNEGERLSEEVGRMAEDARAEGDEKAGQGESADDVKPNPKKRMWEEDKEAAKAEERPRDEL